MNPVGIIDAVSWIAITFAILVLLRGWEKAFSRDVKIILFFLLILIFFHNWGNTLEWMGITAFFDPIEDMLEVLGALMWIFFFYTFLRDLDLSERLRIEARLKESETTMRSIFDNAMDGILLVDLKDRRLYTGNKRMCRMLGYTMDELKGLRIMDIHPEEELRHALDVFERQARGEFTLARNIPVKRKDGSIFYADINSSPVTIGGRDYLVSIFRDITEQKKAEEIIKEYAKRLEQEVMERTKELEDANIKLRELDRLKSMFIASMSHELRTPLNSIIGFTGVILQGLTGDINDEQRDQLQRVYDSARHLLALINDVIDVSKIEAGKVRAYVEECALEDVIKEAISNLRHEIEDKGLAIELKLPEGLRLWTDRRRLLQCILNYLSNAVKFTENGSVCIEAVEMGDAVKISVSDTGIGIRREDLPRLFTPFVRLETPLNLKTKGTGLGLYLTKKLTEEVLKGSVSVESEYGRGSVFSIKIPKELRKERQDEEGAGDRG